MGQVPRANYFCHAPFPNAQSVQKRRFGKGVLSRSSLGCSFPVSEAKRNIPENTGHVPPETPFLKHLFRTPDSRGNLEAKHEGNDLQLQGGHGSARFGYRSIQIDYRQRPFLGGIHFQLQIQNRAARRINCHCRDRSVGISAENLSLLIQMGCRKWGFKRWGFKEIQGYLRKKAFFLRFLDSPGALQALRKRAKKAEKGRKRPISADFQDGRPDTP